MSNVSKFVTMIRDPHQIQPCCLKTKQEQEAALHSVKIKMGTLNPFTMYPVNNTPFCKNELLLKDKYSRAMAGVSPLDIGLTQTSLYQGSSLHLGGVC